MTKWRIARVFLNPVTEYLFLAGKGESGILLKWEGYFYLAI